MREYKPPVHATPRGRSLWVPVVCGECGAVKRNAEGQMMYHDLLAAIGPAWAKGGREARVPWRCAECVETRAALDALAGEYGPVDETF